MIIKNNGLLDGVKANTGFRKGYVLVFRAGHDEVS